MSQRKIAKEVGCAESTVRNIKKEIEASAQNDQPGQNAHPESPTAPSDDTDGTIDLDDLDDDEDQPPL